MRKPVEGLMWLIILLSFCIILGVLLIGGSISLFLAPRMVPVVWFGFCVFGILSIYQMLVVVRDIRTHRGGGMKLYSLVFLIPVFLIVTAAPQSSTPQMLPNQNIGFNTLTSSDTADLPPAAAPSPVTTAPPRDPENTPCPAETSPPKETPAPEETAAPALTPTPEKDIADMQVCVLDQDPIGGQGSGSFGAYLYTPLDDLAGQEITLYGFVYKEDSFPPDTILVSRLMITCCAADAMIVGYHVRVEDADDFSSDEWIQVTGTVEQFATEMYGEVFYVPILIGGTVTRCEAPSTEDAYIYP